VADDAETAPVTGSGLVNVLAFKALPLGLIRRDDLG
jgi:hypothetical protein